MKLIDCANAYQALLELMQREQPYKTALALVLLKSKLQPHILFYLEEERALIKKYAKKDEKGTPVMLDALHLAFESENDKAMYDAEHKKLDEAKIPDKLSVMSVTPPERITPAQLEALSVFLDFEEADA